jgi:pimeloyl-ACP methyl ester carboxylesterase
MKVGDTRLYIENGVPLIMLHGFPEFWWSWRRQIPELARKGFRIVAVDMRGYGKSDAVPTSKGMLWTVWRLMLSAWPMRSGCGSLI